MTVPNASARSLGRFIAQYKTAPITTITAFLALAIGPYSIGTFLGEITGSDEVYTFVFLIAAVVVGIWGWRVTRRRVFVHQKGLYYAARFVERRIPWGAVTAVEGDYSPGWLTKDEGHLRVIRILVENDKPLTLLRFRTGTEEILEALQTGSHPHILKNYQDKLDKNVPVNFGEVIYITQDMLIYGEAKVSWDEIADIRRLTSPDGKGAFQLLNHLDESIISFPSYGIQNIHIFEEFAAWVKRNF